MPTRLTGTPSFASLGVQAPQPPNIVAIGRAPTVNDFATFNTGDLWINVASLSNSPPTAPKAEDVWMLVSKNKRIANATWINFSGGNSLLTLTGNVGGAVPGDVNQNINTVGDNIGITVVGNPATNTLTWSLVGGGGGVATQSFHTDDNNVEVPIGTVVIPPVGSVGQINVLGGNTAPNVYTNINTRQGVDIHTVDVDLNNSIGQPNTNITATTGMYALGTANNFVTDRFMYNYGTRNTFLGNASGNLAFTVDNATDNTCIGNSSGHALVGTGAVQGALNTLIGSNSGSHITDGSTNVFAGSGSGAAATTANGNSSAGTGSFSNIITGSDNCGLGFDVGNNYTGAESGNINIGAFNVGRLGENNVIRVGSIGLGGLGGPDNIFIGRDSGNSTYTVGTAIANVLVGASIGGGLTTGLGNSFVGSGCMQLGTSSSRNSGLGTGSISAILTGSDNVIAGWAGGSAYVGAESSNIVIGSQNPGVIADSHTLRIGNASGAGAGNLNRAFIQGIYGVNPPGGGVQTVVQDMNGQLGTMVGGPPLFATTAFYAWSNGTMGATPFVLGTFEIVPINNVGGTGYDLGGNFNIGTFSYVCPNTGYYWFNAMITTTFVPNTITECTMGFSGSTGTFGPMSFNPFLYQTTTVTTGMTYGGSWLSPLLVAGTNVNIQVLYGGTGGTPPDVEGGSARTFLQGYQVG